jgi:two-component system, response regulator
MTILLADDDDNDAELVLRALRKEGFKGKLSIVKDGEDLVAYLDGAKGQLHRLPDLILLDLRLRCMTGIEVLERLKANSSWTSIPIIMMSGVFDPELVKQAYHRGARGFLLKPFSAEDIQRMLGLIAQYSLSADAIPATDS